MPYADPARNAESCKLRHWRNRESDLVKQKLWRARRSPEMIATETARRIARRHEINEYQAAYRRTKLGKICRTYSGMQNRVRGNCPERPDYTGLPLLDKATFIFWSLDSDEYQRLYYDWVASGFTLRDSPSIDRILPVAGYELSNMQWIPYWENSQKARQKPRKLF